MRMRETDGEARRAGHVCGASRRETCNTAERWTPALIFAAFAHERRGLLQTAELHTKIAQDRMRDFGRWGV